AAKAPEAAPAEPAEAKPVKTADAAPARKAAKASRVPGVTHKEEGGQVSVTVRADGHLRYQDFFLGNPDRLVVDLRDVSSGPGKVFDVGSEPVKRARLAQFSAASPKVARLVLELSRRT